MRNAAGDLAHLLLERGVAADELERALATHYDSGVPFVTTLVEREVVSDAELAAALAHQLGLELVDLTTYRVDRAATEMIAPSICRRHVLLPVAVHDGHLLVAMADPGDLIALDDVRLASGLPTTPAVAARDQILLAIDRYVARDNDLEDLTSVADAAVGQPDLSTLIEVAGDSPMVRYVNSLLTGAVGDGASDVHVEPGERNVRVRYRIDGVLHEIAELPKSIQPALLSRIKVMAEINIAERRIPQDGRLTLAVSGRQVDVRVATLPTVWGEKVVLRVLDNSGVRLDLDQMGFSPANAERVGAAISRPYGLVLVTGPTGSGKTTTLYGALNRISTTSINVITVEDPVEYRLPGVNQVQVNPKASLTFASALRAILRTDPDVVLVGEIRDRETAQIGVEAALTGHLVLSTMHTNDAPSAVTRLVEIGIEPFLVGSSIACVLAQRLVRRLCERCKAPHEPDRDELAAVGFAGGVLPPDARLFRPVGCAHCANIGYRGRMAIHEVMAMSEELEHLTVTGAPSSQLAAVARAEGMTALRDDGLAKAAAGHTSVEEVLRVVR